MDALTSLIAANILFVGGHFAMSHPLRGPLVRTLGEKGFLGLYSLIQLGALVWIVIAFRAVGPGGWPLWNVSGDVPWAVASLLTIVAVVLLFGSLRGNPALPETSKQSIAQARASGVYAVTRHPMMWAFALWAFAHILVLPSARNGITAGSVAVLALLGAHLQDRKKQTLLGDAWKSWEAKTSYWPNFARLGGAGIGLWIAGIIGWVLFTWAHVWLAYVPAGIWRWVG